jgi:hypothetical protein
VTTLATLSRRGTHVDTATGEADLLDDIALQDHRGGNTDQRKIPNRAIRHLLEVERRARPFLRNADRSEDLARLQ